MLKTYKIPVIWQVVGLMNIEANSLEEAIEKAQAPGTPLPRDGNYIEDSFEIDLEGIPYHNRNLGKED